MSLWKKIVARWGTATEVDDVRIDRSTSSLQVIDYAHHEVHSGSHYTYSEANGDLDAAATIEIIMTVADTTAWPHMVARISGALHTSAAFYESTTHTAGVSLTSYNNNRNSANTAGLALNRSDDDNADGTLLFSTEFGVDTGVGANRATGAGETRGDSEFILKQNTKYLLRVTSLTNDNVVAIALSWYEHTDKN